MPGIVTPGTCSLSPAPLLAAAETYRGTIFDLDANRAVGPAEFARLRQKLTSLFRRHGLAAGDRVLLALPNSPLFMAALLALLSCEGSPLLLHWQSPAAELDRYARRFGARFLLAELGEDPARAELERKSFVLDLNYADGLQFALLKTARDEPRGPLLRGVPLHPTSGSTGLPKIALRPGLPAMEEARHYAETMRIEASDLIAAIPPMTHAYGYGVCATLALQSGASLVTTKKFSAQQVQQVLREHPVTVLPTVPAMLDVLLFGGQFSAPRLRWMLAAGATLPRRSAEQFQQRFGVTVCPLMGTTETGGISVATGAASRDANNRDVDGRIGPPMNGIEVRIEPIDAALQAENSPDSPWEPGLGILSVKSSSLMAGYLDGAGDITLPRSDGWFASGDLAKLCDDGTIHLRGRSSEVINVAGLKVVPCEVEEVIAAMPGVREVRVYPGQQRTGGQFVKVAVAVENDVSASDLRAYCDHQLVYYKRPQIIHIVPALPRSPAGKILRDQLP